MWGPKLKNGHLNFDYLRLFFRLFRLFLLFRLFQKNSLLHAVLLDPDPDPEDVQPDECPASMNHASESEIPPALPPPEPQAVIPGRQRAVAHVLPLSMTNIVWDIDWTFHHCLMTEVTLMSTEPLLHIRFPAT